MLKFARQKISNKQWKIIRVIQLNLCGVIPAEVLYTRIKNIYFDSINPLQQCRGFFYKLKKGKKMKKYNW
mgnify:CR=1 FL=1